MHNRIAEAPNQPVKDFAYWRDVILGALGAVCIAGSLGHSLDWLSHRTSSDRNIALGFLLAYVFFGVLSPSRLTYIVYSLLAIVAWGILGVFAHLSLLPLMIILPCALLIYLLLRWKGHLLR